MEVVIVAGTFVGTGMLIGFLSYFWGYSISDAGDIGMYSAFASIPILYFVARYHEKIKNKK